MNKTCLSCPAWNQLEDGTRLSLVGETAPALDGQCRFNSPAHALIPARGIGGDGISLHGIFPPVKSDMWCMNHPDRAQDMTPKVPLEWDKETGFNRAPTLEEARMFATGEQGDAARAIVKEGGELSQEKIERRALEESARLQAQMGCPTCD